MITRGEFGEGEASSSLSRSSSFLLQNSWSHSPNSHLHHDLFPGDSSSSSSSRFCLRSPSGFSLSSYFSNGMSSSEDGSSRFTSPPFDGMMMTTTTKYHKSNVSAADSYSLCESLHLLNIREEKEEEERTRHQHSRNYEGGFRFGASSGFGLDKSSLFANQYWSDANNQIRNFQSYGETLNQEVSCSLGYKSAEMSLRTARTMVSSPNGTFNKHSAPSYSRPKSCVVGRLSDHHQGSCSNSTNNPRVPGFKGYVHLMAKDQHGCRFLQRIFEDGTSLDAMIIYNEVLPHVVELMMDPFGNYLMQKLLDVCNEEQRTQIILIVTAEPGRIVKLSLNAYGTRVVQRLVESIKTKKQIFLVKSALRPGFLNLVRDLNGNHVIQRCLQCLSTEDNEFIFEDATRFCIDIATHRHGCCVLQKCIAYSTGQRREKLISEISRNSLFLAQDPYGNYAVQYVIELRDYSAIAMVLTQFKGHYVELSMQKFSSHTVERCLTICPESRPQIVLELTSVTHFDCLIQHPYANFVIQAALSVTKGSLHATLVEVIRPHSVLRNHPYCKRIFSRNLLRN